MKISVIIRNCKDENGFNVTLDSIKKQSHNDLEILYTGNELACESNIKFCNSVNQAICQSEGELISIIDSEDYLNTQTYEKVNAIFKLSNPDILCMDCEIESKNQELQKFLCLKFKDLITISDAVIRGTDSFIGNKIFKREILTKYNIKFENCRYNDFVFYMEYLNVCKNAFYLEQKLYHLKKNNIEILENNKKAIELLNNMEIFYEFWQQNNLFETKKDYFLLLWVICFYTTYHNSPKSKKTKVLHRGTELAKELKLLEIFPTRKFIKFFYKKEYHNMIGIDYDTFWQQIFSIKEVPYYQRIRFLFFIKYEKDGTKRKLELFGIPFKWNTFNVEKKVLKNFKKSKVKENAVLLLEAFTCHGEIVPGYTKYFIDLGYNVDLIISKEDKRDNVFCRCKDNKINVWYTNAKTIKECVKLEKIKKYKHVLFLSSLIFPSDCGQIEALEYCDCMKNPEGRKLIVDHNYSLMNKDIAKENKILTLSNREVNMVNPHYFGDIKITGKNDKTQFMVAGDFEKNIDLLVLSVKKLLAEEINNFEIIFTGRSNHSEKLKGLEKIIKNKGYVDFEKLYTFVEQADFLLPMLSSEGEKNNRFLEGDSCGSFQLSYGFKKPILIAEKFAEYHDFNDKNAIIYENDSKLYEAMKQAIQMSKNEYLQKQSGLEKLSQRLYDISLTNLKNVLEYKKHNEEI